jgi:anaerobic magnesium-protoporphyrin IX monomethyl ester cyclase
VIESVPFDLERYLQTGEFLLKKQLMIAYYEPGKPVKIYTMDPDND